MTGTVIEITLFASLSLIELLISKYSYQNVHIKILVIRSDFRNQKMTSQIILISSSVTERGTFSKVRY